MSAARAVEGCFVIAVGAPAALVSIHTPNSSDAYKLCCMVCSRKTLIYLILTLNHIYPDYDFSQLRAHHFRKEPGLASAEEAVDSHLLEVSRVRSIVLPYWQLPGCF